MKTCVLILAATVSWGASAAFAQEQTSATIDGHAITVKYSPPAAKTRAVANLHTDADIAFRGIRVPKGDYSIYILSGGPQWQLAVNKATGAKAANYDPKLDLGRVNMTMAKGAAAPACKITLTKIAALAARLDVSWNGTTASAPFHLDRGGNDSEW